MKGKTQQTLCPRRNARLDHLGLAQTLCPKCNARLGHLGLTTIICPDCWEEMALEVGHDPGRAFAMRKSQEEFIRQLEKEHDDGRH